MLSRKFIVAVIFVCLPTICRSEFAMPQVSGAPTADWVRDITQAPYNATCDGVANDRPAFVSFNADAAAQSVLGNSVMMTIPAGKTCLLSAGSYTSIGKSTKAFTIYAPGASITDGGSGNGFGFGSEGQFGGGHGNNGSVRLASSVAGDSCVNFLYPTANPAVTISNIVLNAGTWRLTVSDSTGFTTGQIMRVSDVTASNKGTLEGLQFLTVISSGAPGTIDVQSAGQMVNGAFSYTSGGKINDYSGLFTVGQWVLIGGLDVQASYRSGGFGEPSNPAFYEYVQIRSIDLAAGQICFTAPLLYAYKSTWPNYDVGGNLGPDPGGGSTLWSLDSGWDTEYRIYGLTVATPSAQNRLRGKTVFLRDVSSTGSNGLFPSMVGAGIFTNSRWAGNFEIDKINGPITCTACQFNIFQTQSRSSSSNLTLTNSTINQLNGTPWRATLSNVILNTQFQIGPSGYGTAESFSAATFTTPSFGITGATATNAGAGLNFAAGWSMSGDTITAPMSPNAQPWAVEGSYICIYGNRQCEDIVKILDVSQPGLGTNVAIRINKSYSGSTWPAVTGGKVFIRVHPAPAFTCANCSSTDGILAGLAGASAGAPLYSYWSKAYSGTLGSAVQSTFAIWGKITSLSMNVTNVAGAGATFRLSQFDNWPVHDLAFTETSWNAAAPGPRVDATIMANRSISLSGTYSSSGVQASDKGWTMPDASYVWMSGASNSGPGYTAAPSGCPGASCPSVTVTIQTDQSIQ